MKRALLILLGLCAALSVPAQDYQEMAGALSTVYRGKRPYMHQAVYNGTYMWDNTDFEPGELYYNGKHYSGILLCVDACRMDLLVKFRMGMTSIVPNRNQVSGFRKGEKLFLNLRYIGYEDAPEGYFELLADGPSPLLRQVNKELRHATGDHNGKAIGYRDPKYDPSVNFYYSFSESFYTVEDGHVVRIGKRKARAMAKKGSEAPMLAEKLSSWKGNESPESLAKEFVKAGGIGLPEGYFDAEPDHKTAGQPADDEGSVNVSYRNKVYVIGNGDKARCTVSGIVKDLESDIPLPGVVIYDSGRSTYARTDAGGRYSITLKGGENALTFQAESKETLTLSVIIKGDGVFNISLPDKVEYIQASLVSANSMQNHRTTAMGVESVSMSTMNKVPSAFGEGDILKAVLTLPGVKSVGEASSGFSVRGGSQDQNLILLNGNTIYNPSHLFGIFSAFNPDVVDKVDLYKSSIPASYGGRISSVMDVRTKDGGQKFKGSLGIGLLTGRAHLEGPIGKRTSFNAGVRTTYSDWMMRFIPQDSNYSGASVGFTDANLGLTHRLDPERTLRASAYFATDRFSFSSGKQAVSYGNFNASASYTRKFDSGNFEASAGYDRYANRNYFNSWAYAAYNLDTYIRQVFAKAGGVKEFGAHSLSAGINVIGYALDPGIMSPADQNSRVLEERLERETALEPSIYFSDNWTVSPLFSLEGGLRLSSFVAFRDGALKGAPEIRLSARYTPLPNLSFKAGVNTLSQYIHLISNTAAVSPLDTWKLTDKDIAPTSGLQIASGAYWTHLGSGIDFSVEAYWKRMWNCLDYKPGARLSMNPNLAQDLVPVFGRSAGAEFMIKKNTGKLSGWVSYSYSSSMFKEMLDRGNEEIAKGEWYNAPYDKPHEFKLSANYALTHRYSLSLNIDYSTGRPITVPVGIYSMGGQTVLAYSTRNSYRIPDYFRVDAAFNIDPGHRLTALLHWNVTLGVYNILGNKNPYSVYFTSDGKGKMQAYMMCVFASQIPYINLNILF